jgi:hypothetical protein
METEPALAGRIRSGRGREQSDGTPPGTYGLPQREKALLIEQLLPDCSHTGSTRRKSFKYGNTCPREQQLAQLAFVVVVEEHLQLN